ncbi:MULTISPECIES: DUF7518 family protein [unclassified Methanoculleus]|uniref:DUF7518 family protein n=1 Tax=unclassified Methanoculleus TaxID=2619537 RepID=UPI0025D326F8|nr:MULTISPECIES: hypothetical protein [unclassified Methanoculleus]
MAQKDARIRFLERELAEREKEMETMKEHTHRPASETGDERLRDLERKVRELEALVKGLTEEILDVKSVAMKLSRDVEERRKKPVVAAEKKAEATLQTEPRAGAESPPARAAEPRSPARPAEKHPATPAPEDEDLELIMQNDGTLKPEPRRTSEYIVASTGSRSTPAKGRMKGGKSSERKLFVEQKERPVDDVIQAEEDDTVDL